MGLREALKIIHRVNISRQPLAISNMFTFPNRSAKAIQFNTPYKKSKHDDNIFLCKALPYFNNLKMEFKTLKLTSFANKIKRREHKH